MIISKQIEKRIKSTPKGTLLFIDDFLGEFEYESARKVLQRLHNIGQIMRLGRGIYFVPQKDNTFGVIKPTADQIAEAIAKRDKARLMPTGSYALYKLGLSTQIPMNVVYLTDGSARKIKVGNQKIAFKKTSPRNLAVNHRLTALIIQGLKELGEENIDSVHLSGIRAIINKADDQEKVRENIRYAPVWIQKIVRKILSESGHE